MDKFDRIQQLHRIFRARRLPVPLRVLEEELACSGITVKRAIDSLRDDLRAPLEYDEARKGWWYVEDQDKFELPGLWMTAQELQSLVMLLNLLEHFGEGLLNAELSVVEQQIHKLLIARKIDPHAIGQQFNILPFAHKPLANKIFKEVGEAIVQHKQIDITYTDFKHRQTRRTLSPQTLVYYRDNWYLDAWCHLRNSLRTFALPRITKIIPNKTQAKKIPKAELNAHFSESYGMFSGKANHMAKLRFLPEVAREIAQQQWHPKQTGSWDGDDYLLQIPYSKDIELLGEILRHMPSVIVEAPASLKKNLKARLRAGLDIQM